jgi:hypothetical protein
VVWQVELWVEQQVATSVVLRAVLQDVQQDPVWEPKLGAILVGWQMAEAEVVQPLIANMEQWAV